MFEACFGPCLAQGRTSRLSVSVQIVDRQFQNPSRET